LIENETMRQIEITELFERFLYECEYTNRLSAETIRGYKEVFHLFVLIMPEVTSVQSCSANIMITFFQRLQTRRRVIGKGNIKIGIKTSTVKTYWNRLNSFFTWLLHKQLIKENPLADLRPPKAYYDEIESLNAEDIKKLYAAITLNSKTTFKCKRDTAMISLLLFCGLRRNEFISLKVNDIDFEQRLLTVQSGTSKSRKVRHIPLHHTLLLHLKDYLRERNKRGYATYMLIVSMNIDAGMTKHGIKHWVNDLGQKAKVSFHLHQLRHTFATNLAKKDVNAIKIQRLLGHTTPAMTMSYLRAISTKDLQEDINKLSI
jgi:integrase